MIFDPTDFDGPTVSRTNWIHLMLRGASSALRRNRATHVSSLSPRMLEDIGYYRSHADTEPRKR